MKLTATRGSHVEALGFATDAHLEFESSLAGGGIDGPNLIGAVGFTGQQQPAIVKYSARDAGRWHRAVEGRTEPSSGPGGARLASETSLER
ncbi:MAG: hypothetical protein K0R88_621 [Solirubrobacterales bacterium]|nr:hypothetical protein [Solirubrobacterales bacterium]